MEVYGSRLTGPLEGQHKETVDKLVHDIKDRLLEVYGMLPRELDEQTGYIVSETYRILYAKWLFDKQPDPKSEDKPVSEEHASIPKNDGRPAKDIIREVSELEAFVADQMKQRWDNRFKIDTDGDSTSLGHFQTRRGQRCPYYTKVWSKAAAEIVCDKLAKQGYWVWCSDTSSGDELYSITAVGQPWHPQLHLVREPKED